MKSGDKDEWKEIEEEVLDREVVCFNEEEEDDFSLWVSRFLPFVYTSFFLFWFEFEKVVIVSFSLLAIT